MQVHVGEGALDSSEEDEECNGALKGEGSDCAPQHRNLWNKSQLTTMLEERRKLRSDGSIPVSTISSGLPLSEDGYGESVSPGLVTRSASAKSFSESFPSLQSQRPSHPRLSLSPIQDIEKSTKNSNAKSGSASTSSSSSKVQMARGQQTRPSISLSSSSSFSKAAPQTATQTSAAPSIPPTIRARSTKALLTPSPLSRVFMPQLRKEEGSVLSLMSALRTESPDGHLADEEEDERGSNESGSGSHSDSEGIVSDLDSDLEVENGSSDSPQESPSRWLARSNSVPIPSFASQTRKLTDPSSWNIRESVPSKSSIRTVTVTVPSRPPSILSDSSHYYVERDDDEGDQASTSEHITAGQESLASTRRPSPSPVPGSGTGVSAGSGLGLVNMAPDDNGGNGSIFNVSVHRMRPINLAVPSLERRWRSLIWKGLKETFEGLSDTVSLCAD